MQAGVYHFGILGHFSAKDRGLTVQKESINCAKNKGRFGTLLAGSALTALLAGSLSAEPLSLVWPVQTTFGDSVYLSAPIPLLGSNSVVGSVKLSPHNYPNWNLLLDLPPGVQTSGTLLRRNDSATQIGNAANGTTIDIPVELNSSEDLPAAQIVELHRLSTIEPVVVRITSAVPGFAPVEYPMELLAEKQGDWFVYRASIPGEHVAHGRLMQILLPAGQTVGTGPVALTGARTWWRHNMAFLYPPPSASPSQPLGQQFTFVPGNPTFRSRTIRVQLPRGYAQNPARRYPVLYAQDGQNVFTDGGGPFGSWNLDTTINRLTNAAEIPEIILVGIDNTQDRIAEYIPEYIGFRGGATRGGAYLEMIRNELMPEINSRYRTLTGPENTAHIGSSLGGVLGFEAANEHEDAFGAVVAMSPSFWLNRAEFVSRALRSPSTRARLWIDSGTEGGSSNDSYLDTIAVRDALIESGHPFGPQFYHTVGIGQGHNEAAWRTRSDGALRWLYGPYLPRDTNELWMILGDGE